MRVPVAHRAVELAAPANSDAATHPTTFAYQGALHFSKPASSGSARSGLIEIRLGRDVERLQSLLKGCNQLRVTLQSALRFIIVSRGLVELENTAGSTVEE